MVHHTLPLPIHPLHGREEATLQDLRTLPGHHGVASPWRAALHDRTEPKKKFGLQNAKFGPTVSGVLQPGPAEIWRGPFRKRNRNSVCKTSLILKNWWWLLTSTVLAAGKIESVHTHLKVIIQLKISVTHRNCHAVMFFPSFFFCPRLVRKQGVGTSGCGLTSAQCCQSSWLFCRQERMRSGQFSAKVAKESSCQAINNQLRGPRRPGYLFLRHSFVNQVVSLSPRWDSGSVIVTHHYENIFFHPQIHRRRNGTSNSQSLSFSYTLYTPSPKKHQCAAHWY